jgi:hypothetical protein
MKDTGGPAFPFWCDSNGMANFQGMTLRDYFAAKAMQGFCAGAEAGDDVGEIPSLSYMVADAMLAQRNKP